MQHNQLLTYSDNTTSAHVFCMNAVPLPIIPFRHLSPFRWGVCTTASLFPLESHWHLCTSQFTCNANTQFQWRKFICHNRNLPSTTPQTFLFFSIVQYFCKTTFFSSSTTASGYFYLCLWCASNNIFLLKSCIWWRINNTAFSRCNVFTKRLL